MIAPKTDLYLGKMRVPLSSISKGQGPFRAQKWTLFLQIGELESVLLRVKLA
jgi:hypothetical protein